MGRRTEEYEFLTQEKTGFQVKVLSPFGWVRLGLSIINSGTQGRRPLDAVLGALTSWEIDMTEGPQREGQGAVPPLCPLAMGLGVSRPLCASVSTSEPCTHCGMNEPLDKEKSLAWCAGWQAGKVVVRPVTQDSL